MPVGNEQPGTDDAKLIFTNRDEEFAARDALPEIIRHFLDDAPFKFSARDTLRKWLEWKGLGGNEMGFITSYEGGIAKIAPNMTAQAYGLKHPQAKGVKAQ
jgi:hypothetical protein